MTSARILGINSFLPDNIESNDDLARENPDWEMDRISEKTGITARHIAASDETANDLACAAAQRLLDRNLAPKEEIDFLIVGTQTADHLLPSNACLLQDRLQLPDHVGSLDFNSGCSGYVHGLQLASSLVESGSARNVLVVTADTYSKLIHPRDRTVRALFGDGAAATLVGPGNDGPGIIGPFVHGTRGKDAQELAVPAGGFRFPRSAATAVEHEDEQGSCRSQDNLFMNGQAIFTFALTTVPGAISTLLKKSETKPEEIDWYIYHQANRFMLENLAMCGKIPAAKMVYHLERIGNTVAASIPIAIEAYLNSGRIAVGHRMVLVGFGVGLTWSVCLVTWG